MKTSGSTGGPATTAGITEAAPLPIAPGLQCLRGIIKEYWSVIGGSGDLNTGL